MLHIVARTINMPLIWSKRDIGILGESINIPKCRLTCSTNLHAFAIDLALLSLCLLSVCCSLLSFVFFFFYWGNFKTNIFCRAFVKDIEVLTCHYCGKLWNMVKKTSLQFYFFVSNSSSVGSWNKNNPRI